jgi:hypothetical protein
MRRDLNSLCPASTSFERGREGVDSRVKPVKPGQDEMSGPIASLIPPQDLPGQPCRVGEEREGFSGALCSRHGEVVPPARRIGCLV